MDEKAMFRDKLTFLPTITEEKSYVLGRNSTHYKHLWISAHFPRISDPPEISTNLLRYWTCV